MKLPAVRILPCGGFDIPGLEGWLARLAGEGLRYSTSIGPAVCFERIEPKQVQVHLEPIQGRAEDDPELNALYRAAGWDYWGMLRSDFFVYAAEDPAAQAHTDPEALDYALRRFFRTKLAGGLVLAVLNLLLLGLYRNGVFWGPDWYFLRHYPMETLSDGVTIPFLLSLAGLALLDASYLLGLIQLSRYRRAVKNGLPVRGRRTGWLAAAGTLALLPVLVNTAQLFFGLNYTPYPLEGSGFVTLTEIEGEDLSLSGDPAWNMDRISHGGTLLDPEGWYFRQYGAFSWFEGGIDWDEVPSLEVWVVRYPLEGLARLRAEEMSRSGIWTDLGPAEGADAVLLCRRAEERRVSELTGETQLRLPRSELILRRGNAVLHAVYCGYQDLTDALPAFVRTVERLP